MIQRLSTCQCFAKLLKLDVNQTLEALYLNECSAMPKLISPAEKQDMLWKRVVLIWPYFSASRNRSVAMVYFIHVVTLRGPL